MESHEEAKVKITNKQLNKPKLAAKSKTGTTLRRTFKMKNCHMNYF